MPKAKERKQGEKIKNHGKRKESTPTQEQAHHVMTAKMRKKLALAAIGRELNIRKQTSARIHLVPLT